MLATLALRVWGRTEDILRLTETASLCEIADAMDKESLDDVTTDSSKIPGFPDPGDREASSKNKPEDAA
jgi:hypothetical protein